MRWVPVVMRWLAPCPLRLLRALGWVLGHVLMVLTRSRRHIVWVNLRWCFPHLSPLQRWQMARRHFVVLTQSLLDRAWLWHGSPELLRRRLSVQGDLGPLQGAEPVVMLAPHFVGMDAGGTALTVVQGVAMASMYTRQRHPAFDDWVRQGRSRSGRIRLFDRLERVKQIVSGLRDGEKLYLLPDMDFGRKESVFVPFYGVQAATVPSLSRLARLGHARVLTVATRMTPQGYCLEVGPVWPDFPSQDPVADTARMNQVLQAVIDTMPEQYYWVHKRFKTRPEAEPGFY
jgi:KDO2-lipid IV(A) lauroyltransferase